MKTLRFIVIGLAFISVMSCSKSDTLPPDLDLSSEFVGNWILFSYDYEGVITTIYPDSATQTTYSGTAFEIVSTTFFSENPNNFTSSGHYGVHHIAVDENGQQTASLHYIEVNDLGSWSRTNNNITLTKDGEIPLRGYISELSDNELHLTFNSVSTESLPDNVQIGTTRVDHYVFLRTPY
jgi:hypothetical protein